VATKMKLIQVKTAIGRIESDIRDALGLAESIREDDQYSLPDLDLLRRNLDRLAQEANQALPGGIREAAEREIRRLTEPQFGWCAECGAEWGYRLSAPREPALRCGDCRANDTARVMDKPQNPPKKDFRKNPLMDFLEIQE
jgi:RNA polymerase-binding transcription factor DksA